MILLNFQSQGGKTEQIRDWLRKRVTLEDMGVKLRLLQSQGGISVESTRVILDESTAQAALGSAADAGLRASGVYTYLANSIRAGGREIPYSVITAVDFHQGAMTSVRELRGFSPPSASAGADDAIWLNDWAWRDLGIALGDTVEVDYYFWQEEGRLETRTARFHLAGVVSMGGDVDAALAPDYPGITDARSITAWDPPFPLDLRRIRPKDEDYWDRHKATPKAFVTLAGGQTLWQSRFGKLSAVRIKLPEGSDLKPGQERLAESLRSRLTPEQAGFSVSAVWERGLSASRGSTNFGEYFVYFSFFLIAAAVLLSALFFRLGIEQRVCEVGTLQAVGFPLSLLHRIFLLEGAFLSVGGSLLGLLGASGYGWLMVFGLRTWWAGAVGTQYLYLHVSWTDLGIGAAAGITVSLGTIIWTLRGLQRMPPRALLAGVLESVSVRIRRARSLGIISCGAFLAAALMLLGSTFGVISEVAAYFGAGFLLLVSILSLSALQLRHADPRSLAGRGWPAYFRLGIRNTMHRPGRSLLCIALIAAATFIIVSTEAFRRDPRSVSLDPASGTGGYPLIAHSALPIVYDPNSNEGREALGIPDLEVPPLAQVNFVPFRMRAGDDASCLNLYAPQEPMVLGVSHAFIAGARFSFQDSLTFTPAERQNPWLLLESETQDGAVPAIGDANTIQYILHLAVGRDLIIRRSNGEPVRLRLVAALRDSILQGELLISEANFLRLFQEQEGFRFFLLDVPQEKSASLIRPLEERLADWGFSVESTAERLAAYHQVENTYLSTFQSLGALGLILGTAGLATVLLRNVLERRRELALLRAVGYRRRILSGIIVAENLVLLIWGLACGTICALLAILPALHARGVAFPAAMVGLILFAVLIVGLASSVLAVLAALRAPLLDALRSE
jgi:ABC-type lipoprotein release transport system permease subunit